MPGPDASATIVSASLIDTAAAELAVARCAPMLDALARDAAVNQSGVLHVVIVDATEPQPDHDFETAVVYERSFGRARADWDADYAGFARAKAQLSWRHRCDSHALQALAPQKLRVGDSVLWGSVHLDGIVVAVSGCEAPFDEAASGAVALMLRAQAKRTLARSSGPVIGR